MSYEVQPVEEKDFPIVTNRTSKYTVVINRFINSQLERGKINCSDITAESSAIQTALRKIAKKLSKDLDIVVNEQKEVFIRKL